MESDKQEKPAIYDTKKCAEISFVKFKFHCFLVAASFRV